VENFTLVRPEHLNHHGVLFGGQLLLWVDEYAWLVAARDFPGYRLVTRAMERSEFRTPVTSGAILRFSILPVRVGESSVTYSVDVYADPGERVALAGPGGPAGEPGRTAAPASGEPAPSGEPAEIHVFSNRVTFVCVDDDGRKRSLPRLKRLRSQG
jgi:acyl-CoA hydrolase